MSITPFCLTAQVHHFFFRQKRYTGSVTFAFESQLPSWMTYIIGDTPIVFVAPHGGRRPTEAPILDSIKVNDLHTAELTAELAKITKGYALINHARDRNELDLNRISQVRKEAVWFLDALEVLLSTLVVQHGEARIFFMHGWNVVQPVCDIGVGLKQRRNTIGPASKFAAPTLSAQFFAEEVLPFRDTAVARESMSLSGDATQPRIRIMSCSSSAAALQKTRHR